MNLTNNWIKYYSLITTGAVILITFPFLMPVYHTYLLTEIFIYIIFALSLNLLMGYTGLASLGHAAYWGTGGYTIALLVSKGGVDNFFFCTGVAILSSTIIALVFGFLALRTAGVYFIMITLALGQMLWALAWRWASFTGGSNGLHGISRPDFLGYFSQVNSTSFYYLILIICIPTIFLIHRITISPFGRTLTGIRENEPRMQALGYDTWKYKYASFVLAGVFGGFAGALKVFQDGSINPGSVSISISGLVILMVLTGGPGNFFGPIIGAAIVWIIRSIVSSYTGYWGAVLGVILVIIVMFSPEGVTPLLKRVLMKYKRVLWNH